MAEDKEPEVMTAADLKRKVQAGAPEEEKEQEEMTGGEADGAGDNAEETEAKAGEPSEETGNEGDVDDGTHADAGDDNSAKDKGKRKKKPKKKDPRDEKIEELNDRLLRNLAEFENFRNRSEKEKEARFDMGARSVVEKFLPIVDNLERGIDGLTDEEKETPFATGIIAVYKQLQTAFEEMGVKPIEAVGQEFNPDFHQAVMHEEDDSDAVNQVVEELQKGYVYKDTVVRYSMVKVLN